MLRKKIKISLITDFLWPLERDMNPESSPFFGVYVGEMRANALKTNTLKIDTGQ